MTSQYIKNITQELKDENYFVDQKDIIDVTWLKSNLNLFDIKHEYFLRTLKLMHSPMSMVLIVDGVKAIDIEAIDVDEEGYLCIAIDNEVKDNIDVSNLNYHVSTTTYSSGDSGAVTNSFMDVRFLTK